MAVEYSGSTNNYSIATVVLDDTGDRVSQCIVDQHYLEGKPLTAFLTIIDDAGNEVVFLADEIDDIINALTELKGEAS